MTEHAVYNEETGRWHRQGDSLGVQVVKKGEPVHPSSEGVTAATYPEAFEKLFGHAPTIPTHPRSAHRFHEGD